MTAGRDHLEESEELRLMQLHFAGAVLGVYVHEANNRLATLQEAVGLLGDLLQAVRSGRMEGVKESLRIASGIEHQIVLFSAFTRHLEGFARKLQPDGSEVDISGALEELLGLTARLARQKRIRIEKAVSGGLAPLRREPSIFLLLMHRLVARGCELLPPQGILRLRAFQERGATTIGVYLEESTGPETLADDWIRGLARRLDARLEERPGGAGVEVRFSASVG